MFTIDIDTEAGAMYIRLAEGQVARTRDLDSLTLVDVDEHGNALGIEIVHPGARPFPLEQFVASYRPDDITIAMLHRLLGSATIIAASIETPPATRGLRTSAHLEQVPA